MENIILDFDEMDKRLNYWLDKVEDCYKSEVQNSMNNFRKEIGMEVKK